MATSKFIIFIHRSVGVLGCLIVGGITARLFYLHEYIWAWLFTALIVLFLHDFIKDFFRPKPSYRSYYSLVVFGIWGGWRGYSDYKRDVRLEKYGLAYNKTRERLGIPVIPANWHLEDRGDLSARWSGKQGMLGHERKFIGFDSLHKIEFESDEYNFKGIRDTTISMSILFRYGKGKSKDSIFYLYHLKDTTLEISRHKADSIFDIARIRKDY